ncbi:MAG: hypothetical protein WCJ81_03960 [bacterium]
MKNLLHTQTYKSGSFAGVLAHISKTFPCDCTTLYNLAMTPHACVTKRSAASLEAQYAVSGLHALQVDTNTNFACSGNVAMIFSVP